MSSNLPRMPVRFIPQNNELLKGEYAGSTTGGTDYKHVNPEDYVEFQTMQPTYRTPPDRDTGNDFFRRYPNGALDIDYAVGKVITAISLICDGVMPSMFDQIVLACFYPALFTHGHVPSFNVDFISRTLLKITPEESYHIMMDVHKQLAYRQRFSEGSHSM